MSRTTAYGYDLSGNLVTKGMPNGVAEQRVHDGRNRVGALNNVPVGGGSSYLSAYGYGYDAVGNVMQVAETYPGGSLANRTITNTYDGVYRLVQEEIVTTGAVTVATSYTYDKGNNRISKGVTGGGGDFGGTTYVIGNGSNGAGANQIKSATLPDATVVAFTYDANGNRAQRTAGGNTDVYSYDYENRLVGLDYETGESGTGTYGYSYDYRTRRVSRTEPVAGTTQIVFNGGTSIEEFNSDPASPAVEYVRGHDYGGGVGGLEYNVRSSTASFNQYDSRGDVTGQTDSSGTVTYQAGYKAFGKHPTESGSSQDRQKANTKEEDPTGLLNEGFRYRDLETGTFITRDPIGFAAGPNMYTYVRQNPWTKFDPEGLQDNQPPHPPPKSTPNPTPTPASKQAPSDQTTSGSNNVPQATHNSQSPQQKNAQPAPNPPVSSLPAPSAQRNVLVVTTPDGKQQVPKTHVKDQAQSDILGLPLGAEVPIFVPPNYSPQAMVDRWTNKNRPHSIFDFRDFWSDPTHDFKDPKKSPVGSAIYDAYGNFMFGATGKAAGIPGSLLQYEANKLHPAGQSPINTSDIQSGIDAISGGGKLSTQPYK